MKIYLPHINYTVYVKQINYKRLPDQIRHAKAFVKRDDMYGCTLYIDLKKKTLPADLAHELVHVLQFICLDRNIDFPVEQEHMGYIMHYLMAEITGYSWDNKKPRD